METARVDSAIGLRRARSSICLLPFPQRGLGLANKLAARPRKNQRQQAD